MGLFCCAAKNAEELCPTPDGGGGGSRGNDVTYDCNAQGYVVISTKSVIKRNAR